MQNPKSTIDPASVTRSTDSAIGHAESLVESALRFLADKDAKDRRKESKCKRCYYIWHSRIGGAAMTTQYCGICDTPVLYGSTATDKLCLPCALKHELCKQCGADVQLRPRRIYRP